MPDANDMDLVREFACDHSEAAFTELVRRHVNLVYSIARRCTDTDGDAQDVTQAVFVILARKAAGLRARTVLTGWLYETTRYTAACVQRTNARRHAREQEAYMQSTLADTDTADAWTRLAPHLEAGMSQLGERDRTLLALRFYENKSGPEAAALLGIQEAAAHKRTARALEKLRKFFTQRGVALSAAAIAGAVAANSVQAAPVGLALKISVMAAKGMAATTSITTIVKGTLKLMTYSKLKMAAGVGVAVLLAGGTISMIVAQAQDAGTNADVHLIVTDSMLIVPGQSVGKLMKGMTAEEVQAVLGKPDSLRGAEMSYSERLGFIVLIAGKNGVANVLCRSAFPKTFRGHTKEGIGMESSRDDLIKAYGTPTLDTTENGVELLNYEPLYLSFTLEKKKVTSMVVEMQIPPRNPNALSVRTYKINGKIFLGNLRPVEAAGNNESVQNSVIRYFKENGIKNDARLAVFWNVNKSQLQVSCSVANQNKIDTLVTRLNNSK